MDAALAASLLARTEICQGLPPKDVATIADAGEIRVAWEGEELMRQGSLGVSMLLLLDGKADVTKSDPDGRSRAIASVGAGTVLGEIALLESVPRSATVKAASPVRYFEIGRKAFDALIAREDATAARLAMGLARTMARRQRATHERLMALLVDAGQRGVASPVIDKFLESLVIELEG